VIVAGGTEAALAAKQQLRPYPLSLVVSAVTRLHRAAGNGDCILIITQ
jgi:hypothetical protein